MHENTEKALVEKNEWRGKIHIEREEGKMKQKNVRRITSVIFLATIAIMTSGCQYLMLRPDTTSPPKGAIVLFNGTGFDAWTDQSGDSPKWAIQDGVMQIIPQTTDMFPEGKRPSKVGIQTKQLFNDFRMHIEFKTPREGGDNSGVYIQRRYEIQIVDSTIDNGDAWDCGAIYKTKQPDINVCRPRGMWQSFDIVFRAPRWIEDEGKFRKTENAHVTVMHNGVLIHNNAEIPGTTGAGDPEGPKPAPILLQDHGTTTQFRNVWIQEI